MDLNEIVTPITGDSNKIDTPITINPTVIVTKDPPYPQRLVETGMIPQLEFDFLEELKKLHIRIPLLQSIKDVPIYAKKVRNLCVKKHGRKPKDPVTIHVMGKLLELMTGQPLLTKYNDPWNPTVIVYIDEKPISNTLIDLGATINVMTNKIFTTLILHGLRQTLIVLELENRSRVKPEGMLEDIVITVDS